MLFGVLRSGKTFSVGEVPKFKSEADRVRFMAPLREVLVPRKRPHDGTFSLGARARLTP